MTVCGAANFTFHNCFFLSFFLLFFYFKVSRFYFSCWDKLLIVEEQFYKFHVNVSEGLVGWAFQSSILVSWLVSLSMSRLL